MSHRQRRGHRPPTSRLARFEPLEPRHYLSASNLALTTDAGVQQMPSVAVNPLDPDHVVVAYMDYSLLATGYAGIGVATSLDGGVTWAQRTSVPLPAGFEQGAANPIVKFDNADHDPLVAGVQNRVYVSFMAATFEGAQPPLTNPGGGPLRVLGMQSDNGIFVSSSDDGGLNFGAPATVSSHLYNGVDKVPFDIIPDLAIDTFRTDTNAATGEQVNRMYVSFSRYYPEGQYPGETDSIGGSNIMFAVSTDGGQSWQLQLESQPAESADPVTVIYNQGLFNGQIPEGVGFENWSHVAVGPQGDVYVSQFQGGTFVVHHSSDGGQSFKHPDATTRALYPFGVNIPTVPSPFFAPGSFRLQSVRAIAADPARPGALYVAEATAASDAQGNVRDEGEVRFSRSTDFGVKWQRTFQVDDMANANAVNDENDGRSSTGAPDDVSATQVLPRLVVDAQGNVALVWYDTRRDPSNKLLDVFAAVSTDGGQTFGPNFRVTNNSFDAAAGAFTDATGTLNPYLGDFLGLALANKVMYAAWTDTRAGNQDIFFSRVSLDPSPAASNDRFEPNDSLATAIDLGLVVERDVPKLAVVPADEDWFRLEAAATGTLTISAKLAAPGDSLRLELFDRDGAALPTTVTVLRDEQGAIVGQSLSASSLAGQTYLVRVVPSPSVDSESPTRYTLSVQALTADLGTSVHGVQNDGLADGDKLFYPLTAAAPGSLEVILTPGANAQGNFRLELLDANTLEALSSGQPSGEALHASLAVAKGQKVYLHVVGDAGSQGDFSLAFTNLDQFTTQQNKTAFIPTGAGPSASVLADLNRDGELDIIVSHVGQNIISVIMNNGAGAFQAPREFAVGAFQQGGPFTLFGVENFHRELAVADFNGDGFLDVVAVNTSSSDVSVLLGNGDGTFQPQRRFDATAGPFAMAVGLINDDDFADIVVVDSSSKPTAQGAVLLGRGNGTFLAPMFFTLENREENRTNTILLVDINGDGKADLIERDFVSGVSVLLGNGDGTFGESTKIQEASGPGLAVVDIDRDGDLDVVTTRNNFGDVIYARNMGSGAFETSDDDFADTGQFPIAVAVADIGRAVKLPDGSFVLGPPDGHVDLIVANNGRTLPLVSGPAEVVFLPGKVDANGKFTGFGAPIRLASPKGPLDVKIEHVNDDGVLDIVVVDRDGILIIYGKQPAVLPNDAPETARDLGTVVHAVEPTLTIVPGRTDAYFKLTVPEEAFQQAGNQVLDFSGGFANEQGAGLTMEVLDRSGAVRARGERFRIVAEQGEELFVRVFGAKDGEGVAGTGAYTLIINTLPQVAAIEAHSLLPGVGDRPGGPTTSIVIVFQGDRLDAAAAENAENYAVTWMGRDGVKGGGDDQVIAVGAGLPDGSRSVVYDPSRNNQDAASGRTFPTAIRQTVTLLFGDPLPAGNYEIEVSASVTSAGFNLEELDLLSLRDEFGDHPVATILDNNQIVPGALKAKTNLVLPAGAISDFAIFEDGTSFLTQFHNDMGALLDAELSAFGSDLDSAAKAQAFTELLLRQIVARFSAALGPSGEPIVSMLVIFLDPVSINLVDPEGRSFDYDLKSSLATSLSNRLPRTFVEVGGNVEVVVIPNPRGTYRLQVADVPASARGGAVYFGAQSPVVDVFTAALRNGVRSFEIATTASAAASGFGSLFMAGLQASAVQLSGGSARFDLAALGQRFSAAGDALRSEQTSESASPAVNAGAVDTLGSGGAPPGSFLATIEQAWDELSGLWDDMDGKAPGQRDPLDANPADAPANLSRAVRVWRMMSNIFGEMWRPQAPPPAATDGQNAQRDAGQPKASASDAPPVETSAKSEPVEEATERGEASADQASKSVPAADGTTSSAPLPGKPAVQATGSSPLPQQSAAAARALDRNRSHATAA